MAEQIEVEDRQGNRTKVDRAWWRRWPSLQKEFRPVSEKVAPAAKKAPTGDKEKEN